MGCPGISDGVNVREAEHDGGVVTDEDVGRDKDAGGTGGTWVNSDEGMADDEVVGAGGQGKFLLVPELADGRPTVLLAQAWFQAFSASATVSYPLKQEQEKPTVW